MATLKIVCRETKTRSNGLAPLAVRITVKRKHAYVYLNKYIEPRHWDSLKERVKKGHPDYKRLNLIINKVRNKAQAIMYDFELADKSYSAKMVKDKFTNKNNGKFVEYADKWIEKRKNEGVISHGTYFRYKAVISKFSDFSGKEFRIDELSEESIRAFETYLKEDLNNKPNTIAANMSCLRAICNSLVKDRQIKSEDNPFLYYKLKFEQVQKEYLTKDEIQGFGNVSLKEGSKQWLSQQIFLFCC